MPFISADDFFAQAGAIPHCSREAEKELARRMADGDPSARDALVRSYLPMVAATIKRAPKNIQTLRTVYACIETTQMGVEQFNFLQDNEPFHHHLSFRLRQVITRCIAER